MDHLSASLVLIPLIAAAAPLLAAAVGNVAKIPLVVYEIVLGMAVGPSLLGWVAPSDFMSLLADLGLAMLFFMAGNEIDFAAIKGRPLNRATLGWLISFVAGVAVGVGFAASVEAGVFIGVALGSTALGTILPILRDAGELRTPFGRSITAIGAAGEFGPLLAISLFLSGRAPGPAAVILIIFVLITGLMIWLASRGEHTQLHDLVAATLHTSGQFAIRLALLLIGALVALSMVLRLDMLLGAFAAGVLWQVVFSGASHRSHEVLERKLEAVAFGFLVPIFFIYTGVTFGLAELLADPVALALVPVFLVLLFAVRGLPGLLVVPPGSTAADRRAIVLFGATGLPIIVAVTTIGHEAGLLSAATSAALVGAGMLSVLIFPLVALSQRRPQQT